MNKLLMDHKIIEDMENKIAIYLGNDYNECYLDFIRRYPEHSKIAILYYSSMMNHTSPNILTFIEEFIKTISPAELNATIPDLMHHPRQLMPEQPLLEMLIVKYFCNDNENVIKLIISAGADVNKICIDGNSILSNIIIKYLYADYLDSYYSIIGKNVCNSIKILIDNGADVNCKIHSNGMTIFTYFIDYHVKNNALKFNEYDDIIFELLLKSGAEFNIDGQHFTPIFSTTFNRIKKFYKFIETKQLKTKLALK